jgi:hypothetical protein
VDVLARSERVGAYPSLIPLSELRTAWDLLDPCPYEVGLIPPDLLRCWGLSAGASDLASRLIAVSVQTGRGLSWKSVSLFALKIMLERERALKLLHSVDDLNLMNGADELTEAGLAVYMPHHQLGLMIAPAPDLLTMAQRGRHRRRWDLNEGAALSAAMRRALAELLGPPLVALPA